jgi:hypothetical protein
MYLQLPPYTTDHCQGLLDQAIFVQYHIEILTANIKQLQVPETCMCKLAYLSCWPHLPTERQRLLTSGLQVRGPGPRRDQSMGD